jgi:uncharacterized membrane protein HdeD (DUF308 family)
MARLKLTKFYNEENSMEGKAWYMSKSIVGGYVATICGVVQLFGVVLTPDDQATITAAVVGVATAVGGILAVYGRYKATKPIK